MPLIVYRDHKFRADKLKLVDIVNDIIVEYISQGFKLTLRQIYYQLVARDYIPNTEQSYKNIGNLVNDGRLAGLIDWSAIEDRTRFVRQNPHWDNPQNIIKSAAEQFRLDRWKGQEYYVEVWIEKDALVGVLENICIELDVPLFSCRGYVSQSEMWEAAQRFINMNEEGRQCVLVHLGDHDPSGIDMTRDIRDRLTLFNTFVYVDRVALNYGQIAEYDPPPNPAKVTDSRYSNYVKKYGELSWELDALQPNILLEITKEAIERRLSKIDFRKIVESEQKERNNLRKIAKNYKKALQAINKGGENEG